MKLSPLITLLALLVIFISGADARNYGSVYDRETGNCYQWNLNHDGSLNLKRYDFWTGRFWNITLGRDGSMSGFDSDNNYWSYNSNNDVYVTYGSVILYEPWNGKHWTGKSFNRVCN